MAVPEAVPPYDMAKKKRRPLRDQDPKLEAEGSPRRWQAATILHPGPTIRSKRRTFDIHEQGKSNDHADTTLSDRFHALPTELRAHIFSFLLVQPVKFNAEHENDCPRRTSNDDIEPSICSREACATDAYIVRWRKGECSDIFTSPWRSRWAEEPRNPYVCSICYDGRLRATPPPRTKSLPCLCARRQDLQILLVCKKWYHEAGTVLYTQNTFAFEDETTFISFTTNMPSSHWLKKISKITIMTWLDDQEPNPSPANISFNINHNLPLHWTYEQYFQWAHQPSNPKTIFPLLRTLPSLSSLELDALFLTSTKSVKRMLKLGLRNLKQVKFVSRASAEDGPTTIIWPVFAGRSLIVGGFAEEVARGIKVQRQLRLKKREVIKEAVERMKVELGLDTEKWLAG